MALRTRQRTCPVCRLPNTTIAALHTELPSLRSNTPLEDSACATIRTELQSAEERIRLLNRAIKRLTAQRDHITQVFIAKRRSVIAPIARVPDDVLLHIFDFYIRAGPISKSAGWAQAAFKTGHEPLQPTIFTLSMISRRWRSVTLSYQFLWSIIPPRENLSTSYGTFAADRRLEVQLERSGTSTLSVDLTGDYSWFHPPLTAWNQLLSSANRWGELKLHPTNRSVSWELTSTNTPVLFPSLQTLHGASGIFLESPHAIFTPVTAPLLEDVMFSNLRTGDSGIPTTFPFSQLKRLVISTRAVMLDALFLVIQSCLNLEVLHINAANIFDDPGQRATRKVTLPKLTTARFSVERSTCNVSLATLLYCIRAPALRHISISPPTNMLLKHLHRLIQRSQCDIQEFAVLGYSQANLRCPGYGNYSALPSLLSIMKNLTHITVESSGDSLTKDPQFVNELFRALLWTQARNGSRRCPRLSWVTVLETNGGRASQVLPMQCLEDALNFTVLRLPWPSPRRYDPTFNIQHVTLCGTDIVPFGHGIFSAMRILAETRTEGRTKSPEFMGHFGQLLVDRLRQGVTMDDDELRAMCAQADAAVGVGTTSVSPPEVLGNDSDV